MSDLKAELIKLGEVNPELREHLRPVIDRIATVKTASKTGKCSLGGLDTFVKVDGMEDIEKALKGLCKIEKAELYLSPGMSYLDVYVKWPKKIERSEHEGKKMEMDAAIRSTNFGKQMSRMGVMVDPKGASFTLNL
jgi:hypothetical protein